MMRFKPVFLFLAIVLAVIPVHAQDKLFSKAYAAYVSKDYDKSLKLCVKGAQKYPDYADFYLLSAKNFYAVNDRDKAIALLKVYYEKSHDPQALSEIGFIFFERKNYDSARYYFERFLQTGKSQAVEYYLTLAKFRIYAYAHPVPFAPYPLTNVNTQYNEYFPDISAGNRLFFTRMINDEDIYSTRKIGDGWTVPVRLPDQINTSEQEGACTISPDGKMMIFTRCILKKGCDLYMTKFENGQWTEPRLLPYPINTQYWESQPCLANNGRTLLFVSARPQGKGDMDIWAIDYIGGKWTNLRNLGDSINTPGKEMSPFLHFDGHTLYFASNYHPGLGGYDLFMSKFENGHWTKPRNLGYPINSDKDDTRLIVNVSGDTAYFATVNKDNLDIFYFKLYKAIRPDPTLFVQCNVIDGITKQPLQAKISVYNLDNDSLVFSKTDSNVIFTVKVGEYSLYSEKSGYLFVSKHFSALDTLGTRVLRLTLEMYPLAPGYVMRLHNIFFDFDDYTLKKQSYPELQKLVRFLNNNPTIHVEISGHTDSIGNAQYNKVLSLKRAMAVKNYLVSAGIKPDRITVKGYGSSRPVASNKTPKGRELNRRVEVKIIKL